MARSEVWSFGDTTTVRIATLLCNSKILKQEILCAAGSDYDDNKREDFGPDVNNQILWRDIIVRTTTRILNELCVAEKLIGKIIGIVLTVAMRMLTWATYHEGQIGFSRRYTMRFLNSSLFPGGIIDNKRAAQILMNNISLNLKQKFKLACLYCFTNDIKNLFAEMTKKDLAEFYSLGDPESISQPHVVKFWTYYLMDEVQERGAILDLYRIKKAVKSGSKAAVEYFLTLANFSTDILIAAALAAVKNKLKARDDPIVFRNDNFIFGLKSWVPQNYFVDILSFVLLKMDEDTKIEFFQRDISGESYIGNNRAEVDSKSRVLEFFLNWPFPCEFLKNVELMWDFLPRNAFCNLLLQICDKMTSNDYEDKTYDYEDLFKEFWLRSPERFKKFALRNTEIRTSDIYHDAKPFSYILEKFFTFENFTRENGELLGTLFSSSTEDEIVNILCCLEWRTLSLRLMLTEKWNLLQWFFRSCFPSNIEPNNLKRRYLSSEFWFIFVYLLEYTNLADSFIEWTGLPENEIRILQNQMLELEDFKLHCTRLVTDNLIKADIILNRCIPSEDELIAYKMRLIFSDTALKKFSSLVIEGKSESVAEILHWGVISEEQMHEVKKRIAYSTERDVFFNLITNHCEGNVYDREPIFFEGKWEEIECFLTWCFSSENDIREFKNGILINSGVQIHYNLVRNNKWQEAEIFFSWLELSTEQIRELKRRTLFDYEPTFIMFLNVMYSNDGSPFDDYGGRRSAIRLILRWFLTDEELLHDFRDKFHQPDYHRTFTSQLRESVLRLFDKMLEERLEDMHEEQMARNRF